MSDIGLFLRDNPLTLTPVTGKTFCFDQVNNQLKKWNGANWVNVVFDISTFPEDLTPTATDLVITSAGEKVAIGNLFNATPLADSMRIGSGALLSLTTGLYNIAIGQEAMALHTTSGIALGDFNLALGNAALHDSVSSHHNTAIGMDVLHTCVDGFQNTGVGCDALAWLTSGSYNVGVGTNTLKGVAAGIANVAFGYGALALTTASYNVGLGTSAGLNVTTGNSNILIGYAAGQGVTTGDRNIIIGRELDVLDGTLDYQMNIGNTLYGDLAKFNLGLGTNLFDGTGQKVFTIINGTAPAAHVDNAIQVYSVDSSNATATLGLFTEQAIEAMGVGTSEKIINGGCETTTGWTAVNTADTFEASATKFHSGEKSLHVNDSVASNGGFKQINIPLSVSTAYELSYKIYVVSGVVRAYLSTGDEAAYQLALKQYSTTGEWLSYSESFISHATKADGTIYFINDSAAATAEFYVDEISIKPLSITASKKLKVLINGIEYSFSLAVA